MPYDPTWPPANADLASAAFREQFTGLKTLIDAVPVVGGAVVTNTTTGAPGTAAVAQVQFAGGLLQFQFAVPEGQQGVPGEVTQSQLSNEISNVANFAIGQAAGASSNNSNGVQTLDGALGTSDAEALRVKLNELILALRR